VWARKVAVDINSVDACRNNRHAHGTTKAFVKGRPHNDVCIWIDFFTDTVRSFVEFEQCQIVATSDVDKNTTCTAQANFVEQWVGNGFFRSLDRAIFAFGFTSSHHRLAHLVHHGTYVCKVEVDQAGTHHQVRHTLYALIQNIVCHRKRFGKGGFFRRQTKQVLVRNNDERIYDLLQGFHPVFGLTHTFIAFELERLCHNTNRQNTKFTCGLCNDWRSARSGAAPHPCRDKAHVRSRTMVNDLFNAFFRSGRPNGRTRACTQTFGDFDTKLDAAFGHALLQCLSVSVCDNKVHTVELFFDHIVDRIAASATNAEHCDTGFQISLFGHHQIQSHKLSACHYARIHGCFFAYSRPLLAKATGIVTKKSAFHPEI